MPIGWKRVPFCLASVGEDYYGHADPHEVFQLFDVFVFHPDAAFSTAATDGRGEMGAVYADVVEAGDIESQEPRAVCSGDGAFAVLEVVGKVGGVEYLIDWKATFGSLVVAPYLFVAEVDGAGDAVGADDCSVRAYQQECQAVLVDDDEWLPVRICEPVGNIFL